MWRELIAVRGFDFKLFSLLVRSWCSAHTGPQGMPEPTRTGIRLLLLVVGDHPLALIVLVHSLLCLLVSCVGPGRGGGRVAPQGAPHVSVFEGGLADQPSSVWIVRTHVSPCTLLPGSVSYVVW